MAAATAALTSRFGFFTSEDKSRLIDELGEHISYRYEKGNKDEYFLNNVHHDLLFFTLITEMPQVPPNKR